MDDREDALDFIYKSFREGRQQRRNLAMERANRQRRAFGSLYGGDMQNVVSQPTSMSTPTPKAPKRKRPVRRKTQSTQEFPTQNVTSSPPMMDLNVADKRLGIDSPRPTKDVDTPTHDYANQGFPTRDENTRPDLGPIPTTTPLPPIDDTKGPRIDKDRDKRYNRYKVHQEGVADKLYEMVEQGEISLEQAQDIYHDLDAQNRPKRIEPKTPSVDEANEMMGGGSLNPNTKEAPVETPIPQREVKDDVAQEMIENEKNHKTAFEGAMKDIEAPKTKGKLSEEETSMGNALLGALKETINQSKENKPKKTAKEVVEQTKETPKPKEDKKVKNVVASLPKKKGIEFKETAEGEDDKARDLYVPGKGYVSQSKYTQLKREGYTPKKRRGDDGVERTYMMPPKGAKASEKGKEKVKEVADNMVKTKEKTEKKEKIKTDPKVKKVAPKAAPKKKPNKNTGNKANQEEKKFERKDEERSGAFTGEASKTEPKKKVNDKNKPKGMNEVGDKEPVTLKMLAKAMTARDLRLIEELLPYGVESNVASVGLGDEGYLTGSIAVDQPHTQALLMNQGTDMGSFLEGMGDIEPQHIAKFPLDKVRMPTAKQPPSYENYKKRGPVFDDERDKELMRAWRRGLSATAPNTKSDLMEMLSSGEVTIDGKVINSPGSASRAYDNLPSPSKRNLKYPKNEIYMGAPFYSSKGKDFVLPIYNREIDAKINAHHPFGYRRFDPLPPTTPSVGAGVLKPMLDNMEDILSLLPKDLMRRIKDAEKREGVGKDETGKPIFSIAGSGFDAKKIKNIASKMNKYNPDDFLRFGIGGSDNNVLRIEGRTPDKTSFTQLTAFSNPKDESTWSSINDLLE